jgi:DNA polymerase-4
MGVMKAARLAPDAILLPVDFDAYRHYSRLFKEAVAAVAPVIEDRGIDEIYIDLSELPGDTGRCRTGCACAQIKDAVREATGLSLLDRRQPNKLLSKIASDLDKPDGLTLLDPADIPTRIWPLPVRKINGIGPKADEKLAGAGHPHHRRLAQADPALLQAALRPQLRRLAACGRARHRRPARGHQFASRNRSAARPPSSATCTRAATAPRCRKSSRGCAPACRAT